MIQCQLFENKKMFKSVLLPSVPRIGEAVMWGWGKNYKVWRVRDVTWDIEPEDGIPTAQLSLEPQQ